MAYVCDRMLYQYYVLENMTIINETIIETSYCNIANRNENYAWDIIGMYKAFDNLIQNSHYSINHCTCPSCMSNDEQHIKNTKIYIYIMEFMKTITDNIIIDQIIDFIHSPSPGRGGEFLATRIDEYYTFLDRFDILPDKNRWKNKEWYYQRLFKMPWILKKIGIPPEHYHFRNFYYFEDRIAGHPKALCGWANEGLLDTERLGAF